MATWRELIAAAMNESGETFADMVSTTLTEYDMDKSFYDGFGGADGEPFTLWTTNRVYFPVCYDGSEWVGSVPRNPCNERTSHHGGG